MLKNYQRSIVNSQETIESVKILIEKKEEVKKKF